MAKLLASAGSYDDAIILWELRETRAAPLHTKLEGQRGVDDARFSPDSKKLASASGQEVVLW
jgi:hypothetical protein